jgi:hypothetical protein
VPRRTPLFALAVAASLTTACAAGRTPPDSTRELSLIEDLGHEDLGAGADLRGVDGGADLAQGGCGVGSLVINEIQVFGFGGADDEWVELYNPCPNAVVLNGATLKYRAATNSTPNDTAEIAALSGTMSAGGYWLIAGAGYSGAKQQSFATGTGLGDVGGAVGIRDANGVLVDGAGWGAANNPFVEGSPKTLPQMGRSMARTPNGRDTNNNELDFTLPMTPTPGARN